MLLLAVELLPAGLLKYTYSIAPGRECSLLARPGPDTLPPDDPLILGLVARIKEGHDGYTGTAEHPDAGSFERS